MPNAEERINVFNMGSWQLKKQKPDISWFHEVKVTFANTMWPCAFLIRLKQ
jgi:hypothetical protein